MAIKLQDIGIGDVVRLNSSATRMTVRDVDSETGEVKCIWFDDSLVLLEDDFHPSQLVMLKKADDV